MSYKTFALSMLIASIGLAFSTYKLGVEHGRSAAIAKGNTSNGAPAYAIEPRRLTFTNNTFWLPDNAQAQ